MSSIQATYNTNSHSGTRAKTRHKPKPLSRPPFRFRDLPLEIRNETYHMCLVDHVNKAIEMEGTHDDYFGR